MEGIIPNFNSEGGSRSSSKIDFYGVIFYNVVMLIKLYKIRYLNVNKTITSEKPGYLSEKLKN